MLLLLQQQQLLLLLLLPLPLPLRGKWLLTHLASRRPPQTRQRSVSRIIFLSRDTESSWLPSPAHHSLTIRPPSGFGIDAMSAARIVGNPKTSVSGSPAGQASTVSATPSSSTKTKGGVITKVQPPLAGRVTHRSASSAKAFTVKGETNLGVPPHGALLSSPVSSRS